MLTPYLRTPHIELRQPTPDNASEAFDCLVHTGMEPIPDRDAFRSEYEKLNSYGDLVFEVCLVPSGDVLGLGSLRERDPAGHLKVGINMDVERIPHGAGAEAMMMLVNYAFAQWPEIRRVYIETTEASLTRFRSALAGVRREATLPDHVFFHGRLWDMHYYAITRRMWESGGAPILERIAGRSRRGAERRTPAAE